MYKNCNCHDRCDDLNEAKVCVSGCNDMVEAENLSVNQPVRTRICGRVCNQCGKPAEGVCVSLVKVCDQGCGRHYCRKIATARTDCEGRYEFRVCIDGCKDMYKIVAHGQKPCRDACGDFDCDKGCHCGKRCDFGCDRGFDKECHFESECRKGCNMGCEHNCHGRGHECGC